jgi:hypothetical protein
MIDHRFHALRAFVLAAALLVAQWIVCQHEVQIESHTPDSTCEWCLAYAPLHGGALPSLAPVIAVMVASSLVTTLPVYPFRSVSRPLYASRAPPLSPVM